jgi:hypothetical protein
MEETRTLPLLTLSDLNPFQWALLIACWIFALVMFVKFIREMIEDCRRTYYRNLVKKFHSQNAIKKEVSP